MYSLVKEIRGKDIQALSEILHIKLSEMPEQWEGMSEFRLHGMNRAFVKFLLSRITGFIEQQSGGATNFSTYFLNIGKKPFEVEHIWADKFAEHRDEFDQRHEFDSFANGLAIWSCFRRGPTSLMDPSPTVTNLSITSKRTSS